MRKPNKYDRLLDAYGFGQEVMDLIVGVITDKFDPGWILTIGEGDAELVKNVRRVIPESDDKNWLAAKPPLERNGVVVPFSLASEEYTDHLIHLVNIKNAKFTVADERIVGKIKMVLLFHQEGKEQGLLRLLAECRSLVVMRVIGNRANGRLEVSKFPGWESVPDTVDLSIKEDEQRDELTEIPDAAMYGRLKEIIDMALAPRGYSYPAAIIASSVFLQSNDCNIRATMYGGPVGDIGSGKTVATDRIRMLLGLNDQHPLIARMPYSDRGLSKVCPPGRENKKRLVVADEGRMMMAKGNIENSSLIPLLCSLWSRNVDGGADKHGVDELDVELSILMNIKASGPAEFPEVFSHSTAHGFWRRCIFGVRANEQWEFREWLFDPAESTIKLQLTQPNVSGAVYDWAREWQAGNEDRKLLREIALRTAYIASAVNQDMTLTRESLDAALRFCEWQEAIRKIYQPAQGADDYQVCYNAIEAAFKKHGGHANWRKLSQYGNWSKYYGRVLGTVKKNLEREGVIVEIKQAHEHYWNGGKA
jgi:hypothetical protein